MIDLAEAVARIHKAALSQMPDHLPEESVAVVSDLVGPCAIALLELLGARGWRVMSARGLPPGVEEKLVSPGDIEDVRRALRATADFPAWDEYPLENDPGSEKMLIVGWDGRSAGQPSLSALGAALQLAWKHIAWQRELRRRANGDKLVALGTAVAASTDLPTLYRRAADTALAIASAQHAMIFMLGDNTDPAALVLRVSARDPVATFDAEALRLATEVATRAHRQRGPVSETGHWCINATPIIAGKPFGVLAVLREPTGSRSATGFQRWDDVRIQACANYVAVALQATEALTEQQRGVRELVLLNEVARDCARLGLDGLLPTVCERICRSLSIDTAGMYFADGERQELVWGGGFSDIGLLPSLHSRIPLTAPSLSARAVLSRQARRSGPDEVYSPEMQQYIAATGTQHLGAIPLSVKDRTIGVLIVSRRETPLSDAEMRLLEAIAAEMAVALDNSMLYAQAMRRADDLAVVQGIGEVMARSLDPTTVVREAGLRICRALDSDGVSVYARRSRGFEPIWRHGVVPPRSASQPVPETDPVMALVLGTTEPIDIPASALEEPSRPFVTGCGLERVCVAPLLGTEQREGRRRIIHTGAILVGRRANRPYAPPELRMLGTVAAQLAVAIENAELYAQTRRRADDLALVAEVSRALQEGIPLQAALAPMVEQLARHLGVGGAAIVLTEGSSLRLVARTRALAEPEISLRPDDFVARAIEERVAQPCRTVGVPPRWLLALPMFSGEQTIGSLVLIDPDPGRTLAATELSRARSIGDQVAAAIDRAQLQAKLHQSLRDLDAAQAQLVRRERLAALGELAALVAHEVRNPLGVIMSSLGTLTKVTDLEGDAQRIYEIMVQEAGRLDRIVSDMLDYTRPTVIRLAPGSLARALRDAVASATSSERARGTPVDSVHVTVSVPAEFPPVPMDDRLLHQVFVNLLSNAFQTVPREGGRVALAVTLSGDGQSAYVTVEDNGGGMTPEVRNRLFEPFFTTKAKGSGLGLAMVKRIVDGHGGDIRVEPVDGHGTRFVVRLPLRLRADGGVVIARDAAR